MTGMLRAVGFRREHRWTQRHVSAYLDGELDGRERERMERHVGLCPECGRVLVTLKRTLAGLMGLREDEPADIADGVIVRLRAEGEA